MCVPPLRDAPRPFVLRDLPRYTHTPAQLKFDNFSLSLHGTELIKDCSLELNYGRRYGLIGLVRVPRASLSR